MGCTGAHRRTVTRTSPSPHTHNILRVLCPFSLGPCSVEATVCVSRLFTHTHKKKGAKPFEILSTAHLPCSLSRTNGRLFHEPGRDVGEDTDLSKGAPHTTTSRTSPTLLSPLTDPPRQTFFQVAGVEGGRGGCSKVFRLCEHAQEVFSRPPDPPPNPKPTTPPHPWSYNLAAPSSPPAPLLHLPLPSTAAEAIQLKP